METFLIEGIKYLSISFTIFYFFFYFYGQRVNHTKKKMYNTFFISN